MKSDREYLFFNAASIYFHFSEQNPEKHHTSQGILQSESVVIQFFITGFYFLIFSVFP